MHDAYDRSSKWLIQHHGDAILRLAGVTDIQEWRAVQAEVVQPRKLPDGLLEVQLHGRRSRLRYIVEISTYAERRVAEQILGDALLVYLDGRELPDVLTLVLRPKGKLRVPARQQRVSPQGWTRLEFGSRVVELWKQSATDLLAANDVGLVPWIPLTHFDGPPERLLRKCRERLDDASKADERANLLAVTQVLAQLRFDEEAFLAILGGEQAMIESPLIRDLVAGRMSKDIIRVLEVRFGEVPHDLVTAIQRFKKEARLEQLLEAAASCPDLEAFRTRLRSDH